MPAGAAHSPAPVRSAHPRLAPWPVPRARAYHAGRPGWSQPQRRSWPN